MAAEEAKVDVRYVIVTGASSGIGEGIASSFVDRNKELLSTNAGYRFCVFGVARSKDKLDNLAQTLNNGCDNNSPNFIPIVFDLNEPTKLNELWTEIEKYTQYVHILINNAGFTRYHGGLMGNSEDEIFAMLNVNIVSLTLLSREALNRMKAHMPVDDKTQGFIINISSVLGHVVAGGTVGLYAATKHFTKALTEGLRKEIAEKGNKDKDDENSVKQNIHICLVSPGMVKTNFWSVGFNEETANKILSSKPHLLPKDVADTVMYVIKQPPHANVCDVILRPRLQQV